MKFRAILFQFGRIDRFSVLIHLIALTSNEKGALDFAAFKSTELFKAAKTSQEKQAASALFTTRLV